MGNRKDREEVGEWQRGEERGGEKKQGVGSGVKKKNTYLEKDVYWASWLCCKQPSDHLSKSCL